ncbi:MAG: hypothetical protein IKQ17_09380 [Kiritimatiellae bacterium]|nr:hypothetical protein [Kiritimatiellia bacterium]
MISESEFLAKFEGVQQSGGGWVARCPAHGDDNPSLSIARGEDGRWLVHCHAGCSAEAVVEAVGLKMADLMPSNDRPQRTIKGRWGRWVCDYVYTDEAGKVLYKSCRYVKDDGKKTFIIKTPDPDAKFGWSFGLSKKGIARVPFRLPRVVAAARAGKTIVIVEGEKDVLTVEEVCGCAATCNVAGAMKWGFKFPENWIDWFKGASGIIIVADNDPKTKKVTKHVRGETVEEEIEHWRGQKHAWDVRRRLVEAGFEGKIKLMVMPAVGEEHPKDFTDWVEARRKAGLKADRAAFMEAVKEAAPWPEEWNFDTAALELAAKDDGRTFAERSASTEVAAAEGRASGQRNGGGDTASDTPDRPERGRFGAPVPRAPDEDVERYAVDFDIGGGKFARLELEYGWTVERIFSYALVAVSRKCPNNEIPKGVPVRIKAWSAALWLLMRGSFFWHSDHEQDFAFAMFLDRDKAECRLMKVMSNEFFAFVGKAAKLEDIDPKKGDMAKILGLVKQIAVDSEYARGVMPGNGWERRGDAVYISSGDTEMCRIKDGSVSMVQNGTDGVVFLRGNTLAPWKLVEGGGRDPFAESPIFRDASWMEDVGPMNMRLWVMNLFAQHRTKPILLITGKAQSGKTRMARAIKEILGVRKRGVLDSAPLDLDEDAKGREAFWVAINNGKVEIFDNLDTKVKWVSNTFQNAATGGSTKRRQLYSDDGEAIYEANASIIITSNNPLFSTDGDGGMADRIIGINLSSRSWSAEDTIDADIAANRNEYLTWMARTLAKVLMDKEPVDKSINRRHPAYGEFSVRIGRAIGDEEGAVKALGAAEANKAILPLLNDVVAKGILEVLKDRNWEWGGTSGEMSELIIARQGDDGDDKTRDIYSSRRVGKAFSRYKRQFATLFRMDEPRVDQGRTRYRFGGMTALGLQTVGLVDSEGGFPTSPCASANYQKPEINPPNPPNPPDAGDTGTRGAGADGASARARAPSPLPLNEEEENVENESEDFNWDL